MPEAKIGKLDPTRSRSNLLLANVFLRNSLTGYKQLHSVCQSVLAFNLHEPGFQCVIVNNASYSLFLTK